MPAIGFVGFLIWELTEAKPIVDLRVFRHRGFAGAGITSRSRSAPSSPRSCWCRYGCRSNMGYTATWAGYTTGIMGILAILSAPLVGKAVAAIDLRFIISMGILGLGLIMAWRLGFNSDVPSCKWRCPPC